MLKIPAKYEDIDEFPALLGEHWQRNQQLS